MTVNVTQGLLGPVEIFQGLTGVAEPATADVAPATGWRDLGGSNGGATLTFMQGFSNIEFDQITMPAGARRSSQGTTVVANLAEITLANLRVGLNDLGTPTDVDELEFGGEDIVNQEPDYSAILLRGTSAETGKRRMWIVRRTLSTENIGVAFQKDGQTLIPVTWTAYYVSASVRSARVSDKLATP